LEGFRSKSTGYRSRVMAETTFGLQGVAIRQLSLSRWVLRGNPDTWRGQLDEYNRKDPVFAILGGISNGPWQPVHQFCEEHQIPCIFPITSFPVVSQSDWYTMYLSKGYYLEGEGGAVFLHDDDRPKGRKVLQIVRDIPEGRELSRGFQQTWRDLRQKPPLTLVLKPGDTLTAKRLQKVLAQESPYAIVLWDGPESLKTLELLAQVKNRPRLVLVSSSLLGESMFALKEKVRDFTYLTYPYGMTPSPLEKRASAMGAKKFDAKANTLATTRISQQSYILAIIMDMALADMRGNYYRDNLLDVIGTLMDQDVSLYERLSFGTGNRYASKGCYIVQLAKSGLVKKSGWLVH
jgi:ABC-type branched-subunit amino acid transport system substrate-binding protein